MDLPSFLWLWRIAAWSMGLSVATYGVLAVLGLKLRSDRKGDRPSPDWLRPAHIIAGTVLVGLVLLLLAVGVVGTLGHYGSLGHSVHLSAGLFVVGLTLASAWSASQIGGGLQMARSLHLGLNLLLLIGFIGVSLSGWDVVQKYLP
jgi:hypothetical protein